MPRIVRFGVFELDAARGELRRSGLRVRLQRQPMRVLEALVQRPGELVTREELRRAVWGDGTFVDFDHNLNFCVREVRRALGDSATAPRFVETLPRRGYRFVAPVEVLGVAPAPAAPPVFSGRRALRLAVLIALSVGVADGVAPVLTPPTAATARASTAYLKGIYHTKRDASEWTEGVRWLEAAVREQPSDARAQAALAAAYVQLAEAHLGSGRELFPRARAAAEAALALDASLAEAHVALALARLNEDGDWDGAGRELRAAIAADPMLASARRAYAAYLSARGDDEAAVAQVHAARRIDSLCPIVTGDAALVLYHARRYEEAAELWRAALAVKDDSGAHEGLFHLYLQTGREREAAQEALAVMQRVGATEAARELSSRPAGEVNRAFLRGALEVLDRPGTYTLPERLAVLHASLGEREAALSRLELAHAERSPRLLATLRDPAFDTLRDEPRFQRLLAAVGLGGGPEA